MIQELISLSASSRRSDGLEKRRGGGLRQGYREEAEMRFKTYLNPPRRLETSLTTLSPLVISEGFFMPRQKGGNPFGIYK